MTPFMIKPLLPLLVALLLCGCGKRDDRKPVVKIKGKVTFRSQPVDQGTITFIPLEGGKNATSAIQEGGIFSLSTYDKDDGAIVGKHKVVVKVNAVGPDGKAVSKNARIPAKYESAETTPVQVEIKESKDNLEVSLDQ